MKILVTGSSGLIGSQLVKDLVSEQHTVYSVYNNNTPVFGNPIKLDLTSDDIGKTISEIEPDCIVHLAAMTDIDRCENKKKVAESTNASVTKKIAKESALNGAYLCYLSTSYVFDGKIEYATEDETDHKKPVNNYGLTKLLGENSVLDLVSPWSILRTDLIFGIHPTKRNFLTKVYNFLSNNKDLEVPVDQFVSPTYLPNLTSMIMDVTTKQMTGIYHTAGTERISKYSLAELFADKIGLDKKYLRPVSLSEKNYTATRPADSSLDTSRALSYLDSKPLPIEPSVDLFVRDLNQMAN
ncbi:MAG: sugar nucleotide-binding protein [Nitrosopumilaceae archaeon]|nr:SDR family oxidoreductase [Nitrosopumilaceae archaeon]NIU02508.1 SDR family oxidoreductase [Nitrosopumilaceae archaeon]NIU88969.1 sugar nucleotide-binding protein [Nitrosopumilaceae archaeon]NIV67080.1 sugar nucleotide-binding protein [Nitrosopumilaceae archaeon]NIX63109.1 sugar nucleotide-binding protein [Nitrosopumilaceae archaeon]